MRVYQRLRGNEKGPFLQVHIYKDRGNVVAMVSKPDLTSVPDGYSWPEIGGVPEMLIWAGVHSAEHGVDLRILLDDVEWHPIWGALAD
jgi:hypothetical protein